MARESPEICKIFGKASHLQTPNCAHWKNQRGFCYRWQARFGRCFTTQAPSSCEILRCQVEDRGHQPGREGNQRAVQRLRWGWPTAAEQRNRSANESSLMKGGSPVTQPSGHQLLGRQLFPTCLPYSMWEHDVDWFSESGANVSKRMSEAAFLYGTIDRPCSSYTNIKYREPYYSLPLRKSDVG